MSPAAPPRTDALKADKGKLDQGKLIVGRLHGPHGIKGWNKLQSFTADPEDIANYAVWHVRANSKAGWQAREWEEVRWQGKRLLVRLKGCEDRNQAEGYAGWDIAISQDDLPQLASGEYYWHELMGLKVTAHHNGGETTLGRVVDMMETGANDVLVVEGSVVRGSVVKGSPEEGAIDGKQRLIPYIPGQVVQAVDLQAGELHVDWDPEF